MRVLGSFSVMSDSLLKLVPGTITAKMRGGLKYSAVSVVIPEPCFNVGNQIMI